MIFKAGHKFHGPDGMGYTLTRDVDEEDTPMPSMFAPFGGAPEPVIGEQMPRWLARAITARDIGDHPTIEVA